MPYKPYKKEDNYSYTFGAYPTIELLTTHPNKVLDVIVSSKFNQTPEFLSLIPKGIELSVSDKTIKRITKQDNILALAVFKKFSMPLDPKKSHVVLVSPEDMGNVGTIIRTMLAFDIRDLAIIKPSVDLMNPKLIRAAMGANFDIRAEYFDSFEEYVCSIQDHTIYPFLPGAKETLVDIEPSRPYSLVFGPESRGLGEEFHKIGHPLSIPQSEDVDSLNLSITVGIALYKFTNG